MRPNQALKLIPTKSVSGQAGKYHVLFRRTKKFI